MAVCTNLAFAQVADQSNDPNAFGTEVSFSVLAGQSYAGLTSTVTGASGSGGATPFLSTATILAGRASTDTTVRFSWRTPNLNEYYSTSTVGPMHDSAGYSSLLSDVLHLQGIASTGSQLPDGRRPVDPFVLQLTYQDGAFLDAVYEYGATIDWTEDDIVAAGEIQIAHRPVGGVWTENSLGNISSAAALVTNFSGSWAQFASTYGANDDNLTSFLGCWGVNKQTNHVWAVIDHNSVFSVVPAPGTALLLLSYRLVANRRRSHAVSPC